MAASTCPLEGPACVWPYSTDIPQGAGGEVCEGTPLHDSEGGGGLDRWRNRNGGVKTAAGRTFRR